MSPAASNLNDHTTRAIQVAGVFAHANQTVTSAKVLLIATELAQYGSIENALHGAMVDQAYASVTALADMRRLAETEAANAGVSA